MVPPHEDMRRSGEEDGPLVHAAPDLLQAVERWRRQLAGERRMAAKTVEAYSRDVEQFLKFLTTHLAGPPGLAEIADMRVADIRAFMAARRNDGAGSRTLARGLAGIRSFVRFLEREGHVNGAVFARGADAAQRPQPAAAASRQRRRARWSTATTPSTRSRGSRRGTPPCSRSSTAPACASPRRSA